MDSGHFFSSIGGAHILWLTVFVVWLATQVATHQAWCACPAVHPGLHPATRTRRPSSIRPHLRRILHPADSRVHPHLRCGCHLRPTPGAGSRVSGQHTRLYSGLVRSPTPPHIVHENELRDLHGYNGLPTSDAWARLSTLLICMQSALCCCFSCTLKTCMTRDKTTFLSLNPMPDFKTV